MSDFSPQPKPTPRVLERIGLKRVQAAHTKRVYREVDRRDRFMCRCCKRMYGRVHRHHVVYRSQGGLTTTENVTTLCLGCHARVHAGAVKIEGKDANGRLRFRQVREANKVI